MEPIFNFFPANHQYRLGERVLPSVTQALSLIDDRHYDPFYLHRGSMVHLACRYYDEGCLDEETLDPVIVPYLNSWKRLVIELGFKPSHIEYRSYHKKYFYAGTLDRIGPLFNKKSLLDIKSGSPSLVDELQVAGYWEMVREEIQIEQVFDVYLRDDGGMPKLIEVKKPRLLLPAFLACLELWNWKKEHGKGGS